MYILCLVAIPYNAPGQTSSAHAGPVILHDNQNTYLIGRHLQILEDTAGKWTIDDVRSAAFSNRFRQSEEEVPNLGFSTNTYWLRFRMLDKRTTKESILLEFDLANVDKVTLYLRNKQGRYQSKEAGFTVPFTAREVQNRNPVFVIPASHTDSVLYLRIDPAAINVIPLSVYTNHAFATKENTVQLVFGFFYGIIIIIIILSLVLYLLSKEADFLYYFLYVCAIFCIFFWINGYAYQYLWPTATRFNYKIWVIFCVFMTLFLILFNQRFLRLSHYFPFINKLFNGICLFYLLIAIDGLFLDRDRAIYIGSTAFTFVLLLVTIVSLLCLRKGYKPAIYPFSAYLIILFCYIISFLKSITLLPHTTFTANSFFFGYICECIIFLIGVGYKLSISTREKQEAQQKLLLWN
jgi:adenylate cyclase